MPELPEVETIRQDLLKKVVGSQITEVVYTSEGENLINKTGQNLSSLLTGERIDSVSRRAKYLLIGLRGDPPSPSRLRSGLRWTSRGKVLVFHLKMTGRILVREGSYPTDEFMRLIIKLDDGREIRFTDKNGFGEVILVENIDEVDENLGPEPFVISNKNFNLLINQSEKETIKESLLNQKLISGIGNIYADEALYLAGINPFRSPRSLSLNETTKLLESIKKVLEEGIKHRGTTIDSYRDTDGRPGTHQFYLLVYGKTGKPCRRCATTIEYTEINGRRTHFCPTCQPKEQLSLF